MLYARLQRIQVCALLIFLVFGFSSGYAATAQEEAQQKQQIEQLKKGVIKVTALKSGNVREEGAAIMIGEQEGNVYFLTAYHLIKDASILVESYGKRGKTIDKVKVFGERYDPVHDIAVLVVPSYEISDSVEQLYEIDLSKQLGDKFIIIGHPKDKEWELVWADLHTKSSTRLILKPGAITPADSGGPLLDVKGNLVGIVKGTTEKDYGEVVRIDTALTILDGWGVPYRTKLRVDFCALLNRIIESSKQDFDNMKGVKTIKYPNDKGIKQEIWELNDRSLDITGLGRVRLIHDHLRKSKTTMYVANFGQQRDETECKRVWNLIAQKVVNCIPGGKGRAYLEGKYCWHAHHGGTFFKDPVSFVVYWSEIYNYVELYIYRDFDEPYAVCKKTDFGYDSLFRKY